MKVSNIPIYVEKTLYNRAIDLFLENSSEYIESLYTLGNIKFPGISDLDLIVIPKRNFHSPIQLELKKNLPTCYSTILHHNPFIIPLDKIGVYKYSAFSNLKIYYGIDHLRSVQIDNSFTNQICIALEGFMSYWNIINQLKEKEEIDARICVPIFSSFRFTLDILVKLNIIEKNNYSKQFDHLRNELLDTRFSNVVLEMYNLFKKNLEDVSEVMLNKYSINVSNTNDLEAIYNGQEQINKYLNLNLNQAIQRYEHVQEYIDYLSENNYSYGTIFRTEVYRHKNINFYYRILRKILLLSKGIR